MVLQLTDVTMTMTDFTNKEPVAGLSAASSCIRISIQFPSEKNIDMLTFRPVFTHQCFENEFIEGWRPSLDAEQQSRLIYHSWKSDNGAAGGENDDDDDDDYVKKLHRSYQYLHRTVARLDVHIILSPSCDKCRIEIQTENTTTASGNNDCGEGEPALKKFKMVSSEGGENDKYQKEDKMDVKDVVEKISLATPSITSLWVNDVCQNEFLPATKYNDAIFDKNTSSKEEKESLGYRTTLIGQPLKTYHRKDTEFVITLADGADVNVAKYHNSIQPLARWFIETADDVDITDTSHGTWKVIYLFQKMNRPTISDSVLTLSLLGYITLLHVNSPFRNPHPGVIIRVCQALIFPPFHRAGHGSEMLKSIHEYADEKQNCSEESSLGLEILEINVEDPAPAFVALRDAVDYHRFLALCNKEKVIMSYLHEHDVTSKQFFVPIAEEKVLSVSEHMKITKRQAQIVHEIYKLHQIESWKQNRELYQQVETNYRLMVKKSLRTLREEELGACEDGKEGQKALLGLWFDETLRHYHRILSSKG